MSSSLDYLDLCRLCLVKDRVSVPIFEDEGDVRQMFLKITACLPVKIAREDKLPKKICDDCVYKVELLYQFWNTTANAEKQLLQWLGEVGGLEDKQGYVTEVLDSSAMKQEQPSDNRLDGSIMQVRGHQNNMEMGMMNNMTLITMPTGSEQFTSVPMDTTGTVQTIPSGSSTQVTHDQIVQNQTAVGHMAEEESEEEDNSDEGCDNEEGLPVKEEAEEDPNDQSLEQTAFVNVPISCGEAGPSGLQQQKISEMSEMAMQPSNDVDPKSGIYLFDKKEPRILLPRWSQLEIEIIKAQLKEYKWIKENKWITQSKWMRENSSRMTFNNQKQKKTRKRRRRTLMKKPYCKVCKRYFKNFSILVTHKRVCATRKEIHYQYQPKLCEKTENVHYEIRPLIKCKDCKVMFATTREIFQHRQYLDCVVTSRDEESDLSENTDDEYDYDFLYKCNVCRAKFVSLGLLQAHRLQEGHQKQCRYPIPLLLQPNFVVTKTEIEADFTYHSIGDDGYSCTTCSNGFVYYNPDDLLKHQRAVHSSQEIYCRYCSQKLGSVAEFTDHHRAYHELQSYCRICNETKAIHPQLKPKCLSCCYRLRKPFSDCLTCMKESLYCDVCERSMPTLAHFQFHDCVQPAEHGLTLLMLACPLCMNKFSGLRSLYRHIIKHNDVLSFRCDTCGKLQETWKALKVHTRKFHSAADMRVPKITTVALRKTAEEVIKRFVKNGVELLT